MLEVGSGFHHYDALTDQIKNLNISKITPFDITFIVEGHRFPSHRRVFLSTRSNNNEGVGVGVGVGVRVGVGVVVGAGAGGGFFHALLKEDSRFVEGQQREIEIKGVPAKLFACVHNYFYTRNIAKIMENNLENVALLLQVATMWCLEDLRNDIIGFIRDTISPSTCWQLCNALFEQRDSCDDLFQNCLYWIIHNTDQSFGYFQTANIEVAKYFLELCLDGTQPSPYPLSYSELWHEMSRYEKWNPTHRGVLTGILQATASTSLPRHLMNGHPFKITLDDVNAIDKCRNTTFQNGALKAYWVPSERLFRVYFDHDSLVWQIDITSAETAAAADAAAATAAVGTTLLSSSVSTSTSASPSPPSSPIQVDVSVAAGTASASPALAAEETLPSMTDPLDMQDDPQDLHHHTRVGGVGVAVGDGGGWGDHADHHLDLPPRYRHPHHGTPFIISLHPLLLSVYSRWLYLIRMGTCVSILNRLYTRDVHVDDWHTEVGTLRRSERIDHLILHPSWEQLVDPQKGFCSKDQKGVYLYVRVVFPQNWDDVPQSGWMDVYLDNE